MDNADTIAAYSRAPLPGTAQTVADLLYLLRGANHWQDVIDIVLDRLGRHLDGHRTVLFRLRELPGRGFAQSIAAYWVDPALSGVAGPPTTILQSTITTDPLLGRLAQEERQGKAFRGHTRNLEGFLRDDFENQKIVSFISVSVFANGHLWGTLALNDCVRERDWTIEESAMLDILSLAIGDSIERSMSDAHVSDIIRNTMLQASYDSIVVIDEAGSIVEFNPAAERMFGWTRAEILGKDLLHTLIPVYYREGYASGAEYMEGRGKPMIGRRLETVTQNAAGEIFPIELTTTEMRVAERRMIFGTIRDLRERYRAEAEINQQRERLHQNEKMAAMGSLLAGVSHELNNPLAVVVAQSTLLHEFSTDPQTKSRAEKVRAAAERCGRIVKSFLGMVRLHSSLQTETDLNQAIRAALEVTAYGARSSGIVVETNFAPGPLMVNGDPDQITQVAANFLINSQHALTANKGERRIKVSTFRSENDVGGFAVEDNGPGVPENIRSRIFESYFTTKPAGAGTGIGLSISRSIVERHSGKIWFEPVEPNGARFVVNLRTLEGEADKAAAAAKASSTLHQALIIDDEPDVGASLADILELMGLKARVISEWHSVTETLGEAEYDIIFSDLRMPGTGGIEIYRQILEERYDLGARFVMVTGDMIGARAELEVFPAHARPQILEKPFSMLDVRSVLAAINDQVTEPRLRRS